MIKLFKKILRCNQDELYEYAKAVLNHYGYEKIYSDKNNSYLFGLGNIPIVLVAHLDTVFPGTRKFIEIYYDQEQETMWSPDGLGSDDRAGVLSIFTMLRETSYRPCILFTTNEETNLYGAHMAAQLDIKPAFVIELDRQGCGECVFYKCDNKDFEEYINSFGFTTYRGAYTDISIICPAWGCAGVNLSVGYYYEHSYGEMWKKNDFLYTQERLYKILDSPIRSFKYEEKVEMPVGVAQT